MKVVAQRIIAMSMVIGFAVGTQGLMIDNFTIPNNGLYTQTTGQSGSLKISNNLTGNMSRTVTFSGSSNSENFSKSSQDQQNNDNFASIGINVSKGTKNVPDGYSDPNMLVMQSKGYSGVNWGLDYSNAHFSSLGANSTFTVAFTASGNANQVNENNKESIMPSLNSNLTLVDGVGHQVSTSETVTHTINGIYNLVYSGFKPVVGPVGGFNWSTVTSANFTFQLLNGNGEGNSPTLYSINSVQATPTPELTTLIPLALGVAGLAVYQLKRRAVVHS